MVLVPKVNVVMVLDLRISNFCLQQYSVWNSYDSFVQYLFGFKIMKIIVCEDAGKIYVMTFLWTAKPQKGYALNCY